MVILHLNGQRRGGARRKIVTCGRDGNLRRGCRVDRHCGISAVGRLAVCGDRVGEARVAMIG